jgi:hypothetical protein
VSWFGVRYGATPVGKSTNLIECYKLSGKLTKKKQTYIKITKGNNGTNRRKKECIRGRTYVYYPKCNKSKILTALTGQKTLLDCDIKLIKQLGYTLTTKPEEI